MSSIIIAITVLQTKIIQNNDLLKSILSHFYFRLINYLFKILGLNIDFRKLALKSRFFLRNYYHI